MNPNGFKLFKIKSSTLPFTALKFTQIDTCHFRNKRFILEAFELFGEVF